MEVGWMHGWKSITKCCDQKRYCHSPVWPHSDITSCQIWHIYIINKPQWMISSIMKTGKIQKSFWVCDPANAALLRCCFCFIYLYHTYIWVCVCVCVWVRGGEKATPLLLTCDPMWQRAEREERGDQLSSLSGSSRDEMVLLAFCLFPLICSQLYLFAFIHAPCSCNLEKHIAFFFLFVWFVFVKIKLLCSGVIVTK